MFILVTLLVGLVVGVIAKLTLPGWDSGGGLITVLLAAAGALVAGVLGQGLGWYAAGEGPGMLASVTGAVLVLATYRVIAGRRSW